MRWPYLLVLVTIVASIGPPLWGVGVLHAADLLGTLQPWRADVPHGFVPDNGQVSDTVNAVIPLRHEFARRLAHGDFGLWAPDQGSGIPLGTVPDLALLSPLSLPYYVLPAWWAPAAGKALEMAVAAGFMIGLLRRLGTGRVPAAVGAIVYMNSGFQVAWTNWPQTYVGAFIPMLFWAVERAVQLRAPRALVPVAVAVAMLLLGGFPAVTGHAVLAAGVYALLRVLGAGGRLRSRVGWLVALGGAVLLGIGLAALQMVPFLHRMLGLDLGYRSAVSGQHLPLEALVTSVIPWASGAYVDGVDLSDRNVVESLSFVGAAAAVLMVVAGVGGYRLGLPRGVRLALWGTLLVGGIMVYVGGPVLAAAETLLPPLFADNFVGRLRALLCFLAAVLAGLGAQVLVGPVSAPGSTAQGTAARPRLRELLHRTGPRAVFAAAVVAVLVATAGLASYSQAADAKELAYLKEQARLPVAVGLATVVLVTVVLVMAALSLPRRWRAVAVALLPVLAVVECLPVVWTFWPRIPRDEFYPVTPAHRYVLAHQGQDRVLLQQRVMEPGSTSFYGIRTVAAHQFFEPPWRELIVEADPLAFVAGRNTFPFFGASEATNRDVAISPIMDRLAATYYVTNPGRAALGRQPATPVLRGYRVDLVPGRPLEAPAPTGEVRAVRIWLAETAKAVGRGPAEIHLTVLAPDGSVLATGEHRADDPPASVNTGPVDIAVPQVRVPAGSVVRLELVGARAPLPLSLSSGKLAIAAVRAQDDGLRTVFADSGAVIYQRTRALPRLRWASHVDVVPDPEDRIIDLERGVPADTVVLSAPGPAAGGGAARVTPLPRADGGDQDQVSAQVDAQTAGYLVVADGLQDGWTATVDGTPAPLVDADHALVAVPVPAGRHRVQVRYDSPGWALGRGISAVSVLVCVGLLSMGRRRRGALPVRHARGRSAATL